MPVLFLIFMWCIGAIITAPFALIFGKDRDGITVWFVVSSVLAAAALGMAKAGLENSSGYGSSANSLAAVVYPVIAVGISYALFPKK